MPDETETKRIVPILGPYAGQHLDVPAADADQAIADGWAKDPFAPPPDKPAEPMDDDMRAKAIEAAEKAARKLRGEDEPKDAKSKGRAIEAGAPQAGYETRATAKQSMKTDK